MGFQKKKSSLPGLISTFRTSGSLVIDDGRVAAQTNSFVVTNHQNINKNRCQKRRDTAEILEDFAFLRATLEDGESSPEAETCCLNCATTIC
jgi:hypothetical protein